MYFRLLVAVLAVLLLVATGCNSDTQPTSDTPGKNATMDSKDRTKSK